MNLLICGLMLLGADDSYAKQSFNAMDKNKMANISTITAESKPYLSVVGYALDGKGLPFILVSDLAVHTDNLNNNPNASIMVTEIRRRDNLFDNIRVTFSGKLKIVKDDKVAKELREIYLKKHPDAKEFIDFGDFHYYTMELEKIYFIGGFGEIGEVTPQEYQNR
jgi:putative heme iron utilization protein